MRRALSGFVASLSMVGVLGVAAVVAHAIGALSATRQFILDGCDL